MVCSAFLTERQIFHKRDMQKIWRDSKTILLLDRLTQFEAFRFALIDTFSSELPSLTQMPPRGVFIAEAVSDKRIYRLYSCSLPDTFSNGTLGTGFCGSCRPDSHPAWRQRETKKKRGEKKSLTFWWILLGSSDSFRLVILPGGQSPGERL